MAAQQPQQAPPYSAQHSVFADRFDHVFRTGGRKPAGRRQNWRNEPLVETQSRDYGFLHCATNRSTSLRSSSTRATIAGRRGFITMSHSGATSCKRSRNASRILRFTRFRNTAFPNARGTVNPSLGPPSGSRSTRRQNAAKHRPLKRFPSLYALRKSAVRRIRALFGKPKLVGVSDGSLVANGEFVATLGSAPGKHGAAIFRGHSYAESMCLCPFAVIWLKGAFWHFEFLGPGKHPKRRRLLTFSISGVKSGVKLILAAVVAQFEHRWIFLVHVWTRNDWCRFRGRRGARRVGSDLPDGRHRYFRLLRSDAEKRQRRSLMAKSRRDIP
jgi:hypothetical protein